MNVFLPVYLIQVWQQDLEIQFRSVINYRWPTMCQVMYQVLEQGNYTCHWTWRRPQGMSLWFKIPEAPSLVCTCCSMVGVCEGVQGCGGQGRGGVGLWYSHLTSALTILSTMVSRMSSLLHFTTPSKYCERCWSAWVTVISRLLYVFSAARFCNKVTESVIYPFISVHSNNQNS